MTESKTAESDTDRMYWCIKCDKRHQRDSQIGEWHQTIERPELEESGFTSVRSKPDREQWAAATALVLAIDDARGSEVIAEAFEERWEIEGFDDRFDADARDALDSFGDAYNRVVSIRHSGYLWFGLEASGTGHLRIRDAAREYVKKGMSWGVRR